MCLTLNQLRLWTWQFQEIFGATNAPFTRSALSARRFPAPVFEIISICKFFFKLFSSINLNWKYNSYPHVVLNLVWTKGPISIAAFGHAGQMCRQRLIRSLLPCDWNRKIQKHIYFGRYLSLKKFVYSFLSAQFIRSFIQFSVFPVSFPRNFSLIITY